MKDEDFQNKIYQEYKNFYKEQEKVGFDQDKIPELRELLKANMDRVFRDELKTSYYGQDAERSNQLLMNDVEEFFLPIVQETAQRENRAAESILGIPLHKSDLMTGVYEFTKMFKMGHNGMKLMGEAGLADSKRSELKRFRKLISEGQTNIKIPRRLRKTGPLSEREYNLKDLEKQYAEDLENIEKRMVDILLDNEMVQQQLEAIGQSDVFNKEGDIDFDLDDWQQMLGKQAGQMIGLMLTLGY